MRTYVPTTRERYRVPLLFRMVQPMLSVEPHSPGLKRVLGLWLLVFYGLGTIVGAGIYVLLGEVAKDAGMAMPLAFAGAGLLAAVTGLSYAELAARYPEAAGAPAYVAEGFGSPGLARIIGLIVLFTGLVIGASLARGVAGYLTVFLDLSVATLAVGVVILFTAVACLNVRGSVGIASLHTVIELFGLLLVFAAGAANFTDLPARIHEIVPDNPAEWSGVAVGAFVAFFAYIGFEGLANIAEEAENPQRDLPRAILISILASAVIYIGISLAVVLTVPMDELVASGSPLSLVMEHTSWGSPELMAAIAIVAVPSGLLADLIMTSRLLYGMGRRGLAPAWLTVVTPSSRSPYAATLAVGAAISMFAAFLPFSGLVAATSACTLLIFLFVNLALWRLHARPATHIGFRTPRWLPPVGAALCLLLLMAEIGSWITSLPF